MRNTFVFRPFVLLIRLLLVQMFFVFIHRPIFLLFFHPLDTNWSSPLLYQSFYLGMKFDLRLVLLTLVPFFLLHRIYVLNVIKKGLSHWFWKTYFIVTMLLIQLLYFIDYGHYQYLNNRLQVAAFSFLRDWNISWGMMTQTYSVSLIFLGLLLIILLYAWSLKWCFSIIDGTPYALVISLKRKIITWGLVTLLGALGIYGNISSYPLRWSDAFFSPDPFLSSFALNPVLYFADTLHFKDVAFDRKKVDSYYPIMASYLKLPSEAIDRKNLNFKRYITPKAPKAPKANIVIIVMESFVAFKTGIFGNPLNPTPYADQLAKESYFFNHFYTPVQATARSIFGLVTGIPDIVQVETSSRNPLIINQHTIVNELKEYEKFYFLGGSLSWGNIRGLLQHNIKDIHTFEEGDYNSPKVDVWGISDYDLFEEANAVLKQQKKPFFTIIQTAGYHRPYSIPKKRGNFKERSFTPEELKALGKNGFDSQAEFNSLSFEDYSLGHFIELAKQEDYFDNTIFVIFGDHGLPVKDTAHVSKGERLFDLENFHVPLILYAPKLLTPFHDERFVSELDILPTLASMVGVPYWNTTLGRDIFDPQFDEHRKNFVYYWYTNPPVYGVVDQHYFYTGGVTEQRDLYDYKGARPDLGLKNKQLGTYMNYKDLADAIYETSKYLLYHNKDNKHSQLSH